MRTMGGVRAPSAAPAAASAALTALRAQRVTVTTMIPTQCHRRRRLPTRIVAVAADASSSSRKRLAVFVSGGGSNLRAIHEATQDGRLDADVVVSVAEKLGFLLFVVVSDVPGCGGWTWAQDKGIATRCFPPLEAKGPGKEKAEMRDKAAVALADELLRGGNDEQVDERRASSTSASSSDATGFAVDVVALAGYLKLIPPPLVRAFPRKMLNIHPALLPGPFGGKGFYGSKVHEAVLRSGSRFSGPTVHFVDEAFDRGPILAQRSVDVLYPEDTPETLAKRVLAAEHLVYPEALAALCEGRVQWTEGGIPYY